MNSIGGFQEKEIDGKPFLIYTLLSQTHSPTSSSSSNEAAIDYGGDNLPLQPLFSCPFLRLMIEKLKRKEEDMSSFLPFNTSPHFPNIGSSDRAVRCLLDSDIRFNICKLPVVPLFWCDNKEPEPLEFHCGACLSPELGTSYYFCVTCHQKFHKECVESPLEIKHPSHLYQSLQLYSRSKEPLMCICCDQHLLGILYRYPTYNFSMHPLCAMKPIPIVMNHPKRHPHTLNFFPKQASLACNVCGLIKEYIPTYVCVRCVFIVHQDCVYFPHFIKISRHHHRISFTSFLPTGNLSCGVCRRKVNNNYGAYSCNKCSDYFVHSRCAVRRDVWDGEELEGVHEEPEVVVEPFQTIADGVILHFSHGHHLKLETSRHYDDDKFCQACILPVYEGNFYVCMEQCHFILHETCANAPLKIHHASPRPLTLKVVMNGYNNKGHFNCCSCTQKGCGFVYEDPTGGEWSFRLDVRCASISEPFEYQGHEHPLFLALSPEEEELVICQICQEDGDGSNYTRKLICFECNYIICFRCATLPYKARYKHDKHFLTFRRDNKESDQSDWCDACGGKIVFSRKGGLYSCNICCNTLHVNCLLGKDPYMKSDQTITIDEEEVHIIRNNTMSRPFCHGHDHEVVRCPNKVVFKKKNLTFCCYSCSEKHHE